VVLDHARGVKRADRALQLGGIVPRMADRKQRRAGIEIDRRRVQLELGLERHEMEPHHGGGGLEHAELELHLQPLAPAAEAHVERLRVAFAPDRHPARRAVHVHGERQRRVAAFRIPRPDEVRRDPIARVHLDDGLALFGPDAGARREEGRRPEAAAGVRHAHAAQQPPLEVVGRVGARAADHRRRHARARQVLPDGRPAPEVHRLRRQEPALLLVAVERQVRQVGRGVAPDEIEDAVATRVHTGRERGPRHGCLCRRRGGDAAVAALRAQARERGQLAGREHGIHNRRLKSVETDDDHVVEGTHRRAVAGGLSACRTGRRSSGRPYA